MGKSKCVIIKTLKSRGVGYQPNFYMNLHLKDDLRMESIVS